MTGQPTPDPGRAGPAEPASAAPLPPTSSALDDLRRWQDSGGLWRVLVRTPETLHIALLTCSTGEEMTRLVTSDPQIRDFVGDRGSSED
jgi:hypothetical protein